MDDRELARLLRSAGTAALCSAAERVRAFDTSFMVLRSGICVAGRARTARTTYGENAAVHRAVHVADPGDVLVIDAGQDRTRALFGDILADACRRRGIIAAIVRGAVRDTRAIKCMDFPLWFTSIYPAPAKKAWPGEVDVPLEWGGVRLSPGDWIVADEDGVVAIPSISVELAARAASELHDREGVIRARLATGESTCQIFGIGP